VVGAHHPQVARNVFIARFGQRGRANADQLRLGALADVADRLFEVVRATENGGQFIDCGCLQRNGLAKVADGQNQRERGAALAAVNKRQAPIDPEERERAPQRRAQLQRPAGVRFGACKDGGHALTSSASHGAGRRSCGQMG
jgi:hypothetical protein